MSRASAVNHVRSGGVPHPASVPSQYGILVPEHQQLSVLRLVATTQQGDEAERSTAGRLPAATAASAS